MILTPGSVIRPKRLLRHEKQPSPSQAFAICSAFSNALGNIFPGHLWQVQMNQNLVHIFCASISKKHCYTCHISRFDPDGKKLLMIGAEILERFNLTRGRADVEKCKTIERDLKGDAIPEL
jgi:hypothetical protein